MQINLRLILFVFLILLSELQSYSFPSLRFHSKFGTSTQTRHLKFYAQEKWIDSLDSLSRFNPSLDDMDAKRFFHLDGKIDTSLLLSFDRKGHILLRQILHKDLLQKEFAPEIHSIYESNLLEAYQHKVSVIFNKSPSETLKLSMEECQQLLTSSGESEFPFMQLFNIWRKSASVRSIALSPILGKIAAELLGCDGVRLYQDSVFTKRPKDGKTHWHSDLNMAPFDSNQLITFWIPLQDVPSHACGGTGLSFASGSHRDFSLLYWNDLDSTDLSERYSITNCEGLQLGDLSAHHGWTLHSAPENNSNETRYAYSVSFVAHDAKLLYEEGHIRYPDVEDAHSYIDWVEAIGWGNRIDESDMLPLVFSNK